MSRPSLSRSSQLPVPAGRVLGDLSMRTVNRELKPLAAMTVPEDWIDQPITTMPTGEIVFKSRILMLGVLPIDLHSLYFQEIDPQRGFVEISSSITHREWHHQREVVPTANGCEVTDRLSYRCRVPLLGWLLLPVYALVFAWRHRQLRTFYHA